MTTRSHAAGQYRLLLVWTVALPAGLPFFTAAAAAGRSLNDLTGPWVLFVDDHAVSGRQDVVRTYHPFERHPANPLIRPDRPWEGTSIYLYGTVLGEESGTGLRMWYHALPGRKDDDDYRLLYAESSDGLAWNKPDLGRVEYEGSRNNNIFIRRGRRDHISSVIHAPWEPDPDRRYQMINFDGQAGGYLAAFSPDGLQWTDASDKPVFAKGGDVSQFLRDFHTGRYLGYVKLNVDVSGLRRRAVGWTFSDHILDWPEPRLVLAPDSIDDRWARGIQRTHFYGLSAFAYESMYLGLLWVFRATDDQGYFDGPVFVELVTSHDGIHWRRQEGERPPILGLGPEGAWDSGMVYTAQHPVLRDGKLWLYYGGFDCSHAAPPPWHGAIGLATLRKDGFASLDAGSRPGTVLTRSLKGARGRLRLNYACRPGGSIRVEVRDERGRALAGYEADRCRALTGDETDAPAAWEKHAELPAGRTLRLHFTLQEASLYSFATDAPVQVAAETAIPTLAALYTFENGFQDAAASDGEQALTVFGDVRIEDDPEAVAFGRRSARMSATFSPLETLRIEGTRRLGTRFTLALMARHREPRFSRLFSSAEDRGPVRSGDLIFDADPSGRVIPGLRLTCKGIAVESGPASFADGGYHHLAVTCDDGDVRFYLDGEPISEAFLPGGDPVLLDRDLRVGEDAAHGREEQFRGHLDDILVLGRVLSPAEVRTAARRGAEHLTLQAPGPE